MQIKEIFLFAFEALRDRKVRSILTILMVMVGSALLVAVSGLGTGFTFFFNKQFENLAPNVLFISSSQQNLEAGGLSGGPPPAPKIVLNSAVMNRINSLPSVNEVFPSFQSEVTLISQGESRTTNAFSIDPTKLLLVTPTLEFEEGSLIKPSDPNAIIIPSDVALPPGEENEFLTLGESVKAEYSYIDPTTAKEKKETKNFVVSAIMKRTGNPTVDNAVIFNIITGNTLFQKANKYDSLIVMAQSADLVSVVEEEIRSLYGNNIGITTVEAILETIREFTSGISSFLLTIAIISLVVGAVGTVTTLYTSVAERTREIGTLKALGATNMNILALFLTESILIGLIGATFGILIGIGAGYLLSTGTSQNENNQPITPIYLAENLLSVWIVSVLLSTVSGLLPSMKASKTLPIEALRPQ
ncbi:MAG TPA: ABC transporter permease [Nitrososphaeraceae archaeon]|nr:ABC transporter permease [Nitrososphaeraceae archaeon]